MRRSAINNNNNNNTMADFDDRPISVYDNLNAMNLPTTMNLHTSTPKAKTTALHCTALRSSANDDNQQKQQTQPQQQHLIPNGQSQSQQQQQQQLLLPQQQVPTAVHRQQLPQQLSSNNALYSTPLKASAAKATTTTTTTAITTAAAVTTTPPPMTTTAIGMPPATASSAANFPAQRPLSQHSQSELNESSQSIAAVKAALNDAKSKFFGLNGYAQDTTDTLQSGQSLLNNNNNYNNIATGNEHHKSKVQIVSPVAPPNKPQPKYQNIPENSVIYRQQQQQQPELPPTVPPKPVHRQKSNSPQGNHSMASASPASASPSSLSGMSTVPLTPLITSSPSTSASASPPQDQASSAPFDSKHCGQQHPHLSPNAAYKQLVLNDLDGPQPSQAVYMSTTVPQNIKGSKIAGRHTPTRNSLRHSRMLVVNNKNYQGCHHPNPMNFKCPNLARGLLILQTILGTLLMFLAIWILFLAPNASISDNPYWSGLALFSAGVIGLVLIRYRRIKRHKVRENCFIFLRADSYLLSLVALLLCVVALLCASMHFARLMDSDTRCVSSNILMENASCSCTFNARELSNATPYDPENWLDEGSLYEELEDDSYSIEYRDLSCQEVNGEWTYILGASITLNALGFMVSLAYIVLLACCRNNSKRFYSSVHTSTF